MTPWEVKLAISQWCERNNRPGVIISRESEPNTFALEMGSYQGADDVTVTRITVEDITIRD